MSTHICEECFRPSDEHGERQGCDCDHGHWPPLCCAGCRCRSFEEAHWRILTVQPPWSWAIFQAGGKLIENRSACWSFRGTLLVHAGKRWSTRGRDDERVQALWHRVYADDVAAGLGVRNVPGITVPGHVVGTVELVDCHPGIGCCVPWGETSYVEHPSGKRRTAHHLVLANPRTLAHPVPVRGGLGLRPVPMDVIEAVAGQESAPVGPAMTT